MTGPISRGTTPPPAWLCPQCWAALDGVWCAACGDPGAAHEPQPPCEPGETIEPVRRAPVGLDAVCDAAAVQQRQTDELLAHMAQLRADMAVLRQEFLRSGRTLPDSPS